METVVLFQIELSLAIMSELIISSFFFARKTFYSTGLRALCEGLFFLPAWELTSFFLEFGKMTVPKVSFFLPSTDHYTAASGVWYLPERQ